MEAEGMGVQFSSVELNAPSAEFGGRGGGSRPAGGAGDAGEWREGGGGRPAGGGGDAGSLRQRGLGVRAPLLGSGEMLALGNAGGGETEGRREEAGGGDRGSGKTRRRRGERTEKRAPALDPGVREGLGKSLSIVELG